MRILLLAFALCLLGGCSRPPPSRAPRPAGASSRAYVGEAELTIRYRYAALPRYGLELFVDLAGEGGDVGEVEIEVAPEGLEVLRGPVTWTSRVAEGDDVSGSVELRAGGAGAMHVTIVTKRKDTGVELASDTLRFVVDREEDRVRECRPTDAACGSP